MPASNCAQRVGGAAVAMGERGAELGAVSVTGPRKVVSPIRPSRPIPGRLSPSAPQGGQRATERPMTLGQAPFGGHGNRRMAKPRTRPGSQPWHLRASSAELQRIDDRIGRGSPEARRSIHVRYPAEQIAAPPPRIRVFCGTMSMLDVPPVRAERSLPLFGEVLVLRHDVLDRVVLDGHVLLDAGLSGGAVTRIELASSAWEAAWSAPLTSRFGRTPWSRRTSRAMACRCVTPDPTP